MEHKTEMGASDAKEIWMKKLINTQFQILGIVQK